jgi:predicted transposase YbfD/YdcC
MTANEATIDGNQEQFIASCRKQLIEDELLSCEDGQYFLTDKGRIRVEKELQRYQMMPARMMLIEQYILQRHGFIVE